MKTIKQFENFNLDEANADGTISKNEDRERKEFLVEIEKDLDKMIGHLVKRAYKIGGEYRAPGILYEVKNIFKKKIEKIKA